MLNPTGLITTIIQDKSENICSTNSEKLTASIIENLNKELKMKNIVIASIIASVTATASFANMGTGTATWGGSSGTVHGSSNCQFEKNQAGTMGFNGVDTWNTITNAVVVLKTRNVNNVKVEPNNKLLKDGVEVADVNTNYLPQSTVSVKGKSDATANRNANSLTAGNLKKASGVTEITFSIGGKAVMTEDAVLDMDDNTDYAIEHTVTCLQ
jgi:hypothetical protein